MAEAPAALTAIAARSADCRSPGASPAISADRGEFGRRACSREQCRRRDGTSLSALGAASGGPRAAVGRPSARRARLAARTADCARRCPRRRARAHGGARRDALGGTAQWSGPGRAALPGAGAARAETLSKLHAPSIGAATSPGYPFEDCAGRHALPLEFADAPVCRRGRVDDLPVAAPRRAKLGRELV